MVVTAGESSPVSGERAAVTMCRLVQRMSDSRYDKNVTILPEIKVKVNQSDGLEKA
jgi:hypothetical protein